MTLPGSRDMCRAAVFSAVGQPIEIREVAVPQPGPREALVRITCCTICGSDLHTFSGARSSPMPTVLGHEIIGVVEAVNEGEFVLTDVAGQTLEVGDRVTWSVAASCGSCHRCEGGIPQKCQTLFKYGHEVCTEDHELSGGLAEYCLLQAGTAVVKLPSELPDAVACPANCATATVAAAVRSAGDLAGKRVLVFGAGMLGLTTCAFATVAGAADVSLCDVNEERLAQGARFGATSLLRTVTTDNYDSVFEMSGHPPAVQSAMNAANIGGTIVLVGSVSPAGTVAVDPERIVRRLLSIHGVHNYRPGDLVTAVRFLEEHHHQFPFAELVQKSFSLADVNEAFQFAVKNRPIRVAVIPS